VDWAAASGYLESELAAARSAVAALDALYPKVTSFKEVALTLLEEAHRALVRLEQVRHRGQGANMQRCMEQQLQQASSSSAASRRGSSRGGVVSQPWASSSRGSIFNCLVWVATKHTALPCSSCCQLLVGWKFACREVSTTQQAC
jgi:hypothetical protein